MPPYLLDTATVLWWTLDRARLSRPAASACDSIDRHGNGVLSAISIWEIGIKVKNGKLDIGMPIASYHRLLTQMGSIEIVPVDDLTWLKNLSLDWDHRDPADRTIVALAALRDIEVVTRDRAIAAFYPRTLW